MARSGIDIRDVGLLDELIQEFERSSIQMSHIDADVRIHLGSVRNDLQRQLDVIHDRLRDAECRLSQAETALSACQCAAAAASAMGMCLSCVSEEQEVAMARMDVEKWRMRYSQGQQILSQCQQEISDYESGAHQLIERMCNENTPQVTQQINSLIGMMQDILKSDLDISYTNIVEATRTVEPGVEPKSTEEDSSFDIFRNNNSGATGDSFVSRFDSSLLRPKKTKNDRVSKAFQI